MKNENLHEKAQKKYGGISEEELKKLKTKVEKKRKSYNSPQDIITVFAIFARLALTCVLLSFIDRNPESLIGSSGAAVTQRRHEEAKQVSYVVTGIIGAVSISVIALFAWSMKKRKKREAREFELRELKRLQLEAARKRVAKARRDPQLMPNLSELERRQIMRKYSLDDRLDYDGKDYKDISEDLDYDIEGLLAQYGEIDEDAGFFDRIKQFFSKIFRRKKA